ncbi:hypothetical protein, partial [Clostridium saccharoperbutylacetonicum]|uniref:hypothetical protein n=1 Tax=Clostridium saccharoperbutylacetonicum TaxID=36745 RepID=UPI00055359D7
DFIIKNTPWINIGLGKKSLISKCILTRRSFFDGMEKYINVVKLDYTHPVFKKHMLNKSDIDYIMNKLGVARDLADLNKNIIYELLFYLPAIDYKKIIVKNLF